jgi:SAM-dependent methyltransferase
MDPYIQTRDTYNKNPLELEADWGRMGPRKRHIELAFKLARVEKPLVLELGCGPGRDAAVMAPLVKGYVGIDYSSELIDLAKTKVPSGTFVVGDIVSTPYPPNRDIIIAFASVLHLKSWQLKQVIRKAHQSLRKGGILYISTKAGTGMTTKEDRYGTRTYYFYDADVIQQFAGSGLKLVHNQVEYMRGQNWTEIALQRV